MRMKKLISLSLLGAVSACGGYDTSTFSPQTLALFLLVSSPGVQTTTPGNSSTNVSLNSTVGITFNQSVDDSTLNIQATDGPCSGSIQLSADGYVNCVAGTLEKINDANYAFRPLTTLKENTNYKLKVLSTVRNYNGAFLSREYQMIEGFTTGASTTVIIAHSTGADPRPLNNIVALSFDRDMNGSLIAVQNVFGPCTGIYRFREMVSSTVYP